MKTLTLIVLVGVALLVVGIACDDGDSQELLTLEEYFAQVDEIVAEAEETLEAVLEDARREPTLVEPSNEDLVSSARETLAAVSAAVEPMVSGLSELNPPDEVQDAHNAYVEALSEQSELTRNWLQSEDFELYIVAWTEAQSIEDIRAAADLTIRDEFTAAEESEREACQELESIATENGVDFNCR